MLARVLPALISAAVQPGEVLLVVVQVLPVELGQDVLRALGDPHAGPDKGGDVAPPLLAAGLVVAAEPLDGVKEATEVEVLAVEDGGAALGLAAKVGLEETGVLELEGAGVAGGGAGLQLVDGLGLGGEGEGAEVEGEGGFPGSGGNNAADAEGLGLGADLVDELQGVPELLLGGVEDGGLGDAWESAGAGGGAVP